MGIIPFIYTRFIYAELIHVENFLSDRSPRSSLPTGKQLYSRNSPSVVIVASPFFEKLIQSPPLPGLQNFQSMSMGKRNRSLDERGEGGVVDCSRFSEPLNFTFRLAKIFLHPPYRERVYFPE